MEIINVTRMSYEEFDELVRKHTPLKEYKFLDGHWKGNDVFLIYSWSSPLSFEDAADVLEAILEDDYMVDDLCMYLQSIGAIETNGVAIEVSW